MEQYNNSSDYSQFNLSDKINFDFSIPEYKTDFRFMKINYKTDYDEILTMFFDENLLNKLSFEERNINGDKMMTCYDENLRTYATVSENGFIAMLDTYAFDVNFTADNENVAVFHPDRKEDLSAVYKLADGDIAVQSAIDFINNWLNVEYKKYFPDFNYTVQDVIVRKLDNHYMFEFTIIEIYEVVTLNNNINTLEYEEDTKLNHMTEFTNDVSIQMINVNQINSFTNGNGMLVPNNKSREKTGNVISLTDALLLCEEKFSNFKDMNISDVEVMYTTEPIYVYTEKEKTDENGNTYYLSDPFYLPNTEVKTRLVWAFIIDVDPKEFINSDNGEINTYGDIARYIYVDIQTGEITHQLDIELNH
jgi:hypothetical protein